MTPNPALSALGLGPSDRAVIFHADDIGMCQATVTAYQELLDFGLISAAAVMTPCSWLPAAAAVAQNGGDQADLGVHLTLTSEWSTYRWRPLSAVDPAAGLVDRDGYFHQQALPLQQAAQVTAVRQELAAQVEMALAAGIDVTHVDSHMGTLFHPRLLATYLEIADRYQVPALFFRRGPMFDSWLFNQATPAQAAQIREVVARREAQGYPLLDHLEEMSLIDPGDRLDEAKMRLARLPAGGISYFIVHPARDTPELRAIAPDWPARVADYALFTSPAWRQAIADAGVQIIGYRALRGLLRQTAAAPANSKEG